MSLLVDMMTNTLDPGYQAAAERRAGTTRPGPGRARALTVLGLAVIGGLLALALDQERASAPAAQRARSALVTQVHSQTEAVGSLQQQVDALTKQLAALRAAALADSPQGRAVAARLGALETPAAQRAVHGPAVVVTLANAKAGTAGARSGCGDVQDTDLQSVVNALWAAGAEALAVNGHRVDSLTSIRSAGEAIVVDFKPVDPPYSVVAIGDPNRLETDFASSPAASALRTYSQAYGLGFTVTGGRDVTLPAAPAPALQAAVAGAAAAAGGSQ